MSRLTQDFLHKLTYTLDKLSDKSTHLKLEKNKLETVPIHATERRVCSCMPAAWSV